MLQTTLWASILQLEALIKCRLCNIGLKGTIVHATLNVLSSAMRCAANVMRTIIDPRVVASLSYLQNEFPLPLEIISERKYRDALQSNPHSFIFLTRAFLMESFGCSSSCRLAYSIALRGRSPREEFPL